MILDSHIFKNMSGRLGPLCFDLHRPTPRRNRTLPPCHVTARLMPPKRPRLSQPLPSSNQSFSSALRSFTALSAADKEAWRLLAASVVKTNSAEATQSMSALQLFLLLNLSYSRAGVPFLTPVDEISAVFSSNLISVYSVSARLHSSGYMILDLTFHVAYYIETLPSDCWLFFSVSDAQNTVRTRYRGRFPHQFVFSTEGITHGIHTVPFFTDLYPTPGQQSRYFITTRCFSHDYIYDPEFPYNAFVFSTFSRFMVDCPQI